MWISTLPSWANTFPLGSAQSDTNLPDGWRLILVGFWARCVVCGRSVIEGEHGRGKCGAA